VQLACVRVEEEHPGRVRSFRGPLRCVEVQVPGQQEVAEHIPREDLTPPAHHDSRHVVHRIQQADGAGAGVIRLGRTTARDGGGPGKVVQVGSFVVVEVESTRDRVDHCLGRVGGLALLESRE
jgi:hypothetical protein